MCRYIQVEGGTKPGTPHLQASSRTTCDICGASNLPCFIDGKTTHGLWANMCQSCHREVGQGLGVGLGQKYCKEQ